MVVVIETKYLVTLLQTSTCYVYTVSVGMKKNAPLSEKTTIYMKTWSYIDYIMIVNYLIS